MRFTQALVWICFFVMTTAFASGQEGILTGTVIDKENKEALIGATISIQGIEGGTFTDFDGNYILRNIPAGKYAVVVSYIGYNSTTITDVEIKAGERQKLDILLSANSIVFEEITVVEYRQTNTVEAVLLEIRQAKQVVSGVSSQQIVKSQDNNAAQILSRVPGLTIVDNRFVMVRGLSERYNNVMINNVVAPSTEVDKRTFSFDLISSYALDRLLVFKSGSADLPGDFAGGVMKLYTIDQVGENYFKINLGMGYRVGTTGESFFQSEGSGTDFLGFDNGFRRLPGAFPTSRTIQSSPRNAEIRREAAHSLPNNFVARESMASPDYSLGLSFGRNMKLGRRQLSTVNNINYSTSYQHYVRDFYRYFEWEDRSMPILERFRFDDQVYEKQNRVSILSNWRLRLSDKSYITFRNLYNQIGENETILRRGFDFIQRPNDDLRNYLLGYRSRSIYTGQLEGMHDLNDRNNLRWVFGGSFLREEEPDLRRFRTYRPKDQSDGGFTMQLPPSSNLFETGRYFGDLMEYSVNHGLDYNWYFAGVGQKRSTIKSGYYLDYRSRDFSSRYFSYLYPGFFDPTVGQEISQLPLDRIFSKENIRTVNGLVIEEGTRPIDSYDASNALGAGYISTELPLGRFDIATGVRTEYNVQRMNSRDDFQTITVDNPVLSILPFLNTGFNLNKNSILRLAYSRTVNRPEFRELAPFLFYDYKLEAGRFGNPNLTPATIDNLDLRYEIYMRPGETFNIGGFYKYFNDPIENRTIITTEQPSFTFINADFARNYGVEVEFRKSLNGMTNSRFLDRLSLSSNASVIWSEVDLGTQASAQQRVRPLQGQSPYIVNLAAYYDDQEHGFSGSLVYNIFGDRIFSVGDLLFPTIYELARHSLDLTLTKRIGKRSTYKLGVQNILDAPFRFFQDSDRNEKIDGSDDPIFTLRRGQLVSLTFSYDLTK
jgi:hypothetical protein